MFESLLSLSDFKSGFEIRKDLHLFIMRIFNPEFSKLSMKS